MTYFLFTDSSTTEIYTLSLHDALPIYTRAVSQLPLSRRNVSNILSLENGVDVASGNRGVRINGAGKSGAGISRSEEHTSELQSHVNLVCRLLLEKKKKLSPRSDMTKYV